MENVGRKQAKVENLWKFFGVNSLAAVPSTEAVAFRMPRNAGARSEAIAAWLRCGEIEARRQTLPAYSGSGLRRIAKTLKLLSRERPGHFLAQSVNALNGCGVALVSIPHMPGAGVSGAARWINKTPVIQLSLFHRRADIFWFHLHHEIGHVLLHGRKGEFVEFDRKEWSLSVRKEAEADEFARNALISEKAYRQFLEEHPRPTMGDINAFAGALGIHPGLVAGRLCHDGRAAWPAVSSLRAKMNPTSAAR